MVRDPGRAAVGSSRWRSIRNVVGIALLLGVGAALTLPMWKPAAKRIRWVVIASNLFQDALRTAGIRSDQIGQPDYGALPLSEVPAYLGRVKATVKAYEKYGSLDATALRGARVLEIGPGETIGVALRFIGDGAAHVTAVDKFMPLQTSEFHRTLYRSLSEELDAAAQQNITDAVELRDSVRLNPSRLAYQHKSIEGAAAELAPASVDFIVSNAVLEEIYDLDATLAALDRVLKSGGRQVHVIDLRDYGMFAKYGFHPLEFLTVSDGVYSHMVRASGQPNRRLVDYYRRALTALGYDTTIYVTWVLGQTRPLPEYRTTLRYGVDYTDENLALVRSIRARLLPRYRQLSDDDLLVASILVVAVKTQGTRVAGGDN
ncbi:MAG TPA: methyltransferase domain-containing protein [Vicinamibacterales bacterium]|nr:methyltransferase domain-containing protein [Vicinamibacterales bacterium]